jgi:hypothetical protein
MQEAGCGVQRCIVVVWTALLMAYDTRMPWAPGVMSSSSLGTDDGAGLELMA